MNPKDDVDKMLADTLGGMMPQKKKDAAATPSVPHAPVAPPPPPLVPAPPPRTEGRTRTSAELDRMLQDTLSGLSVRKTTSAGSVAVPRVPSAPPMAQPTAPAPVEPPPVAQALRPDQVDTARVPALVPDRMLMAQPVLAPAAAAPAVEEEDPVDGIRFGQYVLLEKIATGGMAEVWKARMRGVEGFQKIVAIKKILPHLSDNQDFIGMFIDEAKFAAQLNHNNIIHIYDLGKIQSSYYIAMEYVDGSDLKTILKRSEERNHPLSPELALFIASKIASALDYAHRKRDFEDQEMGLVHRDVSPQNVLISEEGDIKLCDFGIAKAASQASHTQAGALKGKLQYMSPEQAWGRSIDRRSDIFALAAVLFEMLTNRKLFSGESEMSILEQVREARVTAPSQFNDEVTPQIDAIVLKALEKDPANRYQTAGEMARDLDSVLYSFRPTPTSADLAIFMHHLSTTEPAPAPVHHHQVEEPETERHHPANELRPKPRPVAVPAPVVVPAPAPVAVPAVAPMPSWDAPSVLVAEETSHKKSPFLPIAIVAIVVIGGAAAFFMTRRNSSPPAPTTGVTTRVAAPTSTLAPTLPAGAASTSMATSSSATTSPLTGTVATTSTAAAIDSSKVDVEVRKRLAAEKAKLDAARGQQQAAGATVPASNARNPQSAPQQANAQPVAPLVENRPVPAPAPAPATTQTVAETRPAPQPQPEAQAPARVQTGELVDAGTAGLTPAHITRQATAAYPPIARMQRLQGSVTLSALVSETGQVLETRIVSGVKGSGLNEAAEQSIRRSTFAPGMKDGVRVKSWATVRVDFKL